MTTTKKIRPGDPFPCPNCGESDWKADYYNAVSQGIELVYNGTAEPYAEDYDGCEDSYDDACTENERYVCNNCEHEIKFGEFRFLSNEEISDQAEIRQAVVDLADILAEYIKYAHEMKTVGRGFSTVDMAGRVDVNVLAGARKLLDKTKPAPTREEK